MDIHESLEHVLRRQEIVADLFYAVFLDRYPQVRRFFEGVDLSRQAVLLSIALKVIEQHYMGGYLAAENYLRYLGTRHDDLGIPENTFPLFREAMLATLGQFHGNLWDEGLAEQWRRAIDKAIRTMLEGYHTRFHV
jgi:hemoglobin-like flavoprotein